MTLVGKELSIIWDFPFFQEHLFKSGYDELTSNETNMHVYMVLACQPRMTVTSCFVYIVIRDLYLIDHLCINPIHKTSELWIHVCSNEIYTFVIYLAIVSKVLHHCHSWLA